jgi:hypothetical protein
MFIKFITTSPYLTVFWFFLTGLAFGHFITDYEWFKLLSTDYYFCSSLDSVQVCNAKLEFQFALKELKEIY